MNIITSDKLALVDCWPFCCNAEYTFYHDSCSKTSKIASSDMCPLSIERYFAWLFKQNLDHNEHELLKFLKPPLRRHGELRIPVDAAHILAKYPDFKGRCHL